MDKDNGKPPHKVEKDKPNEEKRKNAEKSPNASENKTVNKSDEPLVRTSSSASVASSNCKCIVRSASEDSLPVKRNSRKRKLTGDSESSKNKKVKCHKHSKSLENPSKNLKKKHEIRKHAQEHKTKNKINNNKPSGQSKSRGSKKNNDVGDNKEYNKKLYSLAKFGKNFYCPSLNACKGLRPIYIDGSNVAFSHGEHERFSVKGLKICIDYFRKRGHVVKAFVPHFRLRQGETTDQKLLHKLVNKKLVITTPTLYIQNQRRSPYDDWYIVQSAAANGGIIISADNFQDIIKWNPNLRSVIEENRLVPTFVGDMIIFPVDPHGNRQNNLEQFLKF